MRQWLQAVFSAKVDQDDKSISFSLFHQSKDFDIDVSHRLARLRSSRVLTARLEQRNALSLLYAQLELQFGLLR